MQSFEYFSLNDFVFGTNTKKQKVEKYVDNSQDISTTIESSMTSSQTTNVSAKAKCEQDLDFSRVTLVGCDLTVDQVCKIDSTVVTNMTDNITTQMIDTLATQITNDLTTALKTSDSQGLLQQIGKLFDIGKIIRPENIDQTISTKINNSIKKSLSVKLTVKSLQDTIVNSDLYALQNAKFTGAKIINCKDGITFNQQGQITQVVKSVKKLVVDSLVNNEVINVVATKATDEITNEKKSSFSNLAMIIVAGVLGFILIIVVIVVIFKVVGKSGAQQYVPGGYTGAGPSVYGVPQSQLGGSLPIGAMQFAPQRR